MVTFHIAEVLKTGPLLFGEDQVDENGNVLPLGTVKVRLAPRNSVANIRDVYARPATKNVFNPPFVGEQLLVFNGPTEFSSPHVREQGWYYLPYPLNATDDVANNSTPQKDFRSKKTKINIPPKPITLDLALGIRNRPIGTLQPFVQDFLIQSRTGGSIRLGGTTLPHPQYAKQPQQHKEGKLGDPNFAMTLEAPGAVKARAIAEQAISAIANLDPSLKQASQKYRIDDMSRIATGIYAGLSQKYPKLRLGRSCLPITKSIPKYGNPQIVFDSSRIVMNAKEDHAFMLAKKTAAIEGRRIHLVTDRHNVDFDTLMDNIIDLSRQVMKIGTAQAPLATVMGPTGFALNFPQLIRIFSNFLRFATIPCFPLSFPKPSGKPNYDFGLNTFTAATQERSLQGGGGGGGDAVAADSSNISQGVGSSCSPDGQLLEQPGDGKGNPDSGECTRYLITNYDTSAQTLIYRDCRNKEQRLVVQEQSIMLGGVCILKVVDKGTLELTPAGNDCEFEEEVDSNEQELNVKLPIDPPDICQGFLYEFKGRVLDTLSRTSRELTTPLLLLSGKDCEVGWYLLDKIPGEEEVVLAQATLLTTDTLADDICLRDNIQKLKCKGSNEITSVTVVNKFTKVPVI